MGHLLETSSIFVNQFSCVQERTLWGEGVSSGDTNGRGTEAGVGNHPVTVVGIARLTELNVEGELDNLRMRS